MYISCLYSLIVILMFLVGIFLDVLGLYVGVKFASLGKPRSSKIGFILMIIGEKLEKISYEGFIFIPIVILINFIR